MAEFNGFMTFPVTPLTCTIQQRPLRMKRRYNDDYYDSSSSSDECYNYHSAKRFVSEEMMSSHMRQLHLTTPPNQSPVSSTDDDYWSEYNTCTTCNESLLECLEEDVVLMEENCEQDSPDEEKTDIHMWIAPELKNIMTNKQSLKQPLVPNQILNSVNKPCQALIPYTELQLTHSVWKNNNDDQELVSQPDTPPSPLSSIIIPTSLCDESGLDDNENMEI